MCPIVPWGRTDRREEANGGSVQFCGRAYKWFLYCTTSFSKQLFKSAATHKKMPGGAPAWFTNSSFHIPSNSLFTSYLTV